MRRLFLIKPVLNQGICAISFRKNRDKPWTVQIETVLSRNLLYTAAHISFPQACFTKLSGIDPYEKRIDYPGWHAWGHVFMACSKLEAMVIYLVKQAYGNDKRACVYYGKPCE